MAADWYKLEDIGTEVVTEESSVHVPVVVERVKATQPEVWSHAYWQRSTDPAMPVMTAPDR